MKPGSKYHHLVHGVRKLNPGEVYIASYPADFTCKPESFQKVVYDLAATKGGGWQGTSTIVGVSVVYAFFKRSDYMRPNLPACPVVVKMQRER
jgi:hypothetical protein